MPKFLKDFRDPRYVNVYERLPQETRFFGTETLFGDWDADVLLLAQDCGVIKDLDARIASGHPTPHGHGEKLPTNTKLSRLTAGIPGPKLYGSALGSLWRLQGSKRGKPPGWNDLVHSYSVPMLKWAVGACRAAVIACLGEFAWETVMLAGEKPARSRDWSQVRDTQGFEEVRIGSRTIRAFAMFHPANPRGYDVLGRNYPKLCEHLRAVGL